jgi:glycosyltransferase involved in cell wall biosynthesis
VVAVHQVLPVFAPRDAIGNHTAAIRRCLRACGIGGEIFAGEVVPGAPDAAHTVRRARPARLAGAEPTLWLYHASTGSAVAEWFADLPGPKAIDYHNITPAESIEPWEPHIAVELRHGRRQLAELAGTAEWAIADSAYNASELRGLGYRWAEVVPILLDATQLAGASPGRSALGPPSGTELLFVSRLLPHKGQHDLVKALAAYRLAFDPSARLTLVGAPGSTRYADALADFVADLGLQGAVTFAGSVSPAQLAAHFARADVYVSASAHEGFGVPLLEAMAHDVPVVAYASSAVPETVGDAAVLVPSASAPELAAAVHRVAGDPALRASLVARGRRRLAALSLGAAEDALRSSITSILDVAGLTSVPA